MVLHRVSSHREKKRETVLHSKQFDKLFHHVSYGGTHSANSHSQPFWDWDAEEKGKGREGVKEKLTLVRMHPFSWEKKRFFL